MLTRVKQLWALPESAATDESVFLERRRMCKAIAAGPALLAGGGAGAVPQAKGANHAPARRVTSLPPHAQCIHCPLLTPLS